MSFRQSEEQAAAQAADKAADETARHNLNSLNRLAPISQLGIQTQSKGLNKRHQPGAIASCLIGAQYFQLSSLEPSLWDPPLEP